MNAGTRNSSLFPLGLPLFAGLSAATLVYSLAHILLELDTAVAPIVALVYAAGILLLCTAAALLPEEDAFYVWLLGGLLAVGTVVVGAVMAAGSEHPDQAGIIIAGAVVSGIVGLTLLPRKEAAPEEVVEREGLPLRPILGNAVLAVVLAGVVIYGLVKQATADTPPTATQTPPATATATAGPDGTPAGGTTVAISAGDNFFDPNEVTVSTGEAVNFEVTSIGAAVHNLAITGGPTSDIITAGATVSLAWTAPGAAADVAFRCDFHPEMTGTIHVQ
jgi:plastocyanin